jgi:hypothetical protein
LCRRAGRKIEWRIAEQAEGVHKMLRSSPHPKPPTGYPREAVGDLMGLKEKW